MIEIGRQTVCEQGSFSLVKIWYEGHIPNIKGTFTTGYQGEKLTMVYVECIRPLRTYEIQEEKK